MCPDCTAATQKLWHGFALDCPGCKARAISRGPNFRDAKASGRQGWKYRQELTAFAVEHQQVVAAAGHDAMNRKAA
jgi:hypothetical protein